MTRESSKARQSCSSAAGPATPYNCPGIPCQFDPYYGHEETRYLARRTQTRERRRRRSRAACNCSHQQRITRVRPTPQQNRYGRRWNQHVRGRASCRSPRAVPQSAGRSLRRPTWRIPIPACIRPRLTCPHTRHPYILPTHIWLLLEVNPTSSLSISLLHPRCRLMPMTSFRRLKITTASSPLSPTGGPSTGSPNSLYERNTGSHRRANLTAEPDTMSDAASSSYAARGPAPHRPRQATPPSRSAPTSIDSYSIIVGTSMFACRYSPDCCHQSPPCRPPNNDFGSGRGEVLRSPRSTGAVTISALAKLISSCGSSGLDQFGGPSPVAL